MNLVKNFSGGLGVGVIIAIMLLFTIYFTEVASNTATANIILPVVIALGIELKHSPVILALTFAFACNSAFMLPVATPPNALVFARTNDVSELALEVGEEHDINCFSIRQLIEDNLPFDWLK